MGETMMRRTLLLSLAVFLPMSLVYAQANNVEKRFMERANAVRDSLGLAPLVNLSAHREVSVSHARYVYRTGDFSHTQQKRLAGTHHYRTHSDRVKAFGPKNHWACAEILTGGSSSAPVYHNLSDVELAYQCVENFMNSPPHRQALLAPSYRDCTVGIIWSGKKYVCVVNFVRKDLW